ncbi:MAG: TolC family protein [Mariniblastus sp.]
MRKCNNLNRILILLITASVVVVLGCKTNRKIRTRTAIVYPTNYENQLTAGGGMAVERPMDSPAVTRASHSFEYALQPLTSADQLPPAFGISIDNILEVALSNTTVLRSLGAQVLSNPQGATGVFDPAIQATDPLFGIEAALSEFDANLSASLNHANNDDVFNNSILGGGATEVLQDLTTADFAIQKNSAVGTAFALRSNYRYDSNNNRTSTFPSSYQGFWEAEARHPLLQGNGLEFNRIAGPNSRPGFRNTSGLLVSRINNDISIGQFEQGVRQFVNETIEAYWNLYFAYRNFESTKMARDTSLETWNSVKARFDNDLPGGEADKESQAREQYYLFQQQVVTALNGDPRSGVEGILQAEANLRRLVGLPQNDGRLLRPTDSPTSAKTVYDWNSLVNQALDDRVEIRQQLWRVKRRELELLASRNFLLPRLDAVATFRNNGFGDDLVGGGGRFSSLLSDMSSGDHNEWEMGLQMNVPLGFRQASAGVRNSELQLRRERAILEEQEKQIIHELGTAVRQTEQYHSAVKFAYNRMVAAQDTVDARQAAFAADAVPVDLLLEAQRRLAESQTAYHRAEVNLQLANESVNRESGQLLASHSVGLDQMPSCNSAGVQVAQRQSKVRSGKSFDYRY